VRILLTVDPEIPVPPLLYGGIERIVDGLVRELRARGHEVGLIAHPDSRCAVDFFAPWIFSRPTTLWQHLRHFGLLRKVIASWQPEIVHSFSRLGYLLAAKLAGVPAIMSYQRHTGGRQIAWMNRLPGDPIHFTACSESIAAMGRPWGGKWEVIPNFVDCASFDFRSEVPATAPLVFLSRIESIKGTHWAIDIAVKAKRKLIIAGNRVDSFEGAKYWEEMIAPRLDNETIRYVGPVDDTQKNALLGSAAALVVPVQWDEPFGIVFAEALACGTPVISCPRGALPEIVQDGRHGFLIRSVETGVAAVGRLSEISRTDCRKQAEEKFSVPVVADLYHHLYKQVLEKK
jgi:glycosyltransferase involved in cell wall biosynthesis